MTRASHDDKLVAAEKEPSSQHADLTLMHRVDQEERLASSTTSDVPRGAPQEGSSEVLRRSLRGLVLCLVAIVIVAVLTLVIVWHAGSAPAQGTLRYEVGKAALQVIAVAVVGAVVSIAIFQYQHVHQQDATRWRDLEQQRVENWRRLVDNHRDIRERQDEAGRTLLAETVAAYNSVKRERRLLRARTSLGLTLEVYDAFVDPCIESQLKFEQLARLAPLVDAWLSVPQRPGRATGSDRSGFESLADRFSRIENYLQELVTEYEDHRRDVASARESVPLADLPKLADFLQRRDGAFRRNVSENVDDVIEALQAWLLAPLGLPDAQSQSSARASATGV